jgi:hypothetical protein
VASLLFLDDDRAELASRTCAGTASSAADLSIARDPRFSARISSFG